MQDISSTQSAADDIAEMVHPRDDGIFKRFHYDDSQTSQELLVNRQTVLRPETSKMCSEVCSIQ